MDPTVGVAPAFSTTTFGLTSRSTRAGAAGSVASTVIAWIRTPVARTRSDESVRDSAYTSVPASASASAIPRPKPRLAPTTTARVLLASLIAASSCSRDPLGCYRFGTFGHLQIRRRDGRDFIVSLAGFDLNL